MVAIAVEPGAAGMGAQRVALVLALTLEKIVAPEDLVAMGYHTSRAVYDVKDVRPDEFLCPGNCETCGMCWRLNSLKEVRGTAFEVH